MFNGRGTKLETCERDRRECGRRSVKRCVFSVRKLGDVTVMTRVSQLRCVLLEVCFIEEIESLPVNFIMGGQIILIYKRK